MQNIIKDFVDKNYRLLRIIVLIVLTPIIIYLSVFILQTILIIGNYVGTFLRSVYDFFVCGT